MHSGNQRPESPGDSRLDGRIGLFSSPAEYSPTTRPVAAGSPSAAIPPPPPWPLSPVIATSVWQVGVLRAGAWAARGLRVPARNALLADVVHPSAYGRAYGFERMMDNLGAIFGPLLALALVAALGVRWAIGLSVIPGLLASAAIGYAIRHTPKAKQRGHMPLRIRIRPVLRGDSADSWARPRRSRSATSPPRC